MRKLIAHTQPNLATYTQLTIHKYTTNQQKTFYTTNTPSPSQGKAFLATNSTIIKLLPNHKLKRIKPFAKSFRAKGAGLKPIKSAGG